MPFNKQLTKGKKKKTTHKKINKKRRTIIIAIISVFTLFLCGIGAYGIYAWNQISTGESAQTVPKNPVIDVSDLKGCISVLLLGTDKRSDTKDKFFF